MELPLNCESFKFHFSKKYQSSYMKEMEEKTLKYILESKMREFDKERMRNETFVECVKGRATSIF